MPPRPPGSAPVSIGEIYVRYIILDLQCMGLWSYSYSIASSVWSYLGLFGPISSCVVLYLVMCDPIGPVPCVVLYLVWCDPISDSV